MKFRRQQREEVGINLTPLIDVVFLLLIFFMVSTTFTRETQLSIDLPEAEGSPRETLAEEIEILIDESGRYRVNGRALADNRMRTLQAAIYKISTGDTTIPITISGDKDADWQSVMLAMDAAGRMGFVHLGLNTKQPAEQSAPPGSG